MKKLNGWLEEEEIKIDECEDADFDERHLGANLRYPVSGGLLTSVETTKTKPDRYRKFYVSGVKDCLDVCEAMMTGEVKGCFIEMNACHGGCINGPATAATVSSFRLSGWCERFPETAELSALTRGGSFIGRIL